MFNQIASDRNIRFASVCAWWIGFLFQMLGLFFLVQAAWLTGSSLDPNRLSVAMLAACFLIYGRLLQIGKK